MMRMMMTQSMNQQDLLKAKIKSQSKIIQILSKMMKKSLKINNKNKIFQLKKKINLFKKKEMKKKVKEMDMIKEEIKARKVIGLKIKLLKKKDKIKMKNNMIVEVKEITKTNMKIILLINNKIKEMEINKIEMIIIENSSKEEKIRGEVDIGQRMKQAMTNKYAKIIRNKIKI